MKTILYLSIMLAAITTICFGQANTTLSNLVSPTFVNQDLLPKTDSGQSVGSYAKAWKRIYLAASVYLADSLFLHNQGSRNTFLGQRAGFSTTSGANNIASGFHALYANTSGSFNTANGAFTLNSNTTGEWNIAVGFEALYTNTTGYENTAMGGRSLKFNTTGYYNSAFGHGSLYQNTTGYQNTTAGRFSMFSNTTGNRNTANGFLALHENRTGYYNTAVGNEALGANTTGFGNTAIGAEGLFYNTTGEYNTGIGRAALFHNIAGYDNTAIGAFADVEAVSPNLHNATAIGFDAVVSQSNKVRVGNSLITSIGGAVGWSTFSDGRYKKNIKQDVQGLAFINILQPITYTVDINGLNEYYDKGRKRDSSYKKMKESTDKASKIIYNGFIAQDVEKAAAKLNYNFSGVDKPQNRDGLYGLRYADFVVPLAKAVQELSAENNKKDNEINDLKVRLERLENLMLNNSNNSINTSSYLKQNVPNPTKGNTVIPFQIAAGSHAASIQIIQTGSGKIIKTIAVDINAKQTILNTASLASGNYVYSLVVDGKQADSKQMILAR